MNERTLYRALIIRPLVLLGLPLLVLSGYTCTTKQTKANPPPISKQEEFVKTINIDGIDYDSLSKTVRYAMVSQEENAIRQTRQKCAQEGLGDLRKTDLVYTDHQKNVVLCPDPEEGEGFARLIRKNIEDSQKFFACDFLSEANVDVVVPHTLDELYSTRLQSFDFDNRVSINLVQDIGHEFQVDATFSTQEGVALASPVRFALSEFLDPRMEYMVLKTSNGTLVRQIRRGIICSTRRDSRGSEAAVIQAPVAGVLMSQLSPYVEYCILEDAETRKNSDLVKQKHVDRSHRLAYILTGAWFLTGFGKPVPDEQAANYLFWGFDQIVREETLGLRHSLESGDRTATRELIQRFRDEPNYLGE